MTKAFLAVLLLTAAPAFAQTPQRNAGNPLEELCTGFLAQGGQGISGDQNRLCTCLVRETQARLTRPEMEAYAKAAESGQAPPPAVMQKVVAVATQCLTEAQ